MAINLKIKQELEEYLQNRAGRDNNKAFITSAHNLNTEEIKAIRAAIPVLKMCQITNLLDERILGGFIIKFNTKIIDLSLSGQLKNFKKLVYEID